MLITESKSERMGVSQGMEPELIVSGDSKVESSRGVELLMKRG